MVDIISETHCREILRKINAKYEFESYIVKPLIQESVGGLIGLHYNLQIKYLHDDIFQTLQLFVKTLNNENKVMFEISQGLLFYEKEKLFFSKFLAVYENCGINVAFAPKCYFSGDNSIILEDLSLLGYKMYPKEKTMDLEHCFACLNTIAEFHASSLIYEICKSKELGRKFSLLEEYFDSLQDLIFSGGDTYGTKYVEESIRGLLALAELEFDDETSLQNLNNVFNSNHSSSYENFRCVLVHGDLWSNNFLHRYDDDGRVMETKLIDFQTIKYRPPCFDVLQLIFTNTRKSFRDDHFEDLLSYYYQKLDEIFNDRALRLQEYLPKDEFLETCKLFQLEIKLQAVIDRSLTAIPDEIHQKTRLSDEKFFDFIFVNRPSYLVDYYSNIPSYRELLSEDLQELRTMLIDLK